jgi:hypothetical protein
MVLDEMPISLHVKDIIEDRFSAMSRKAADA